MKDIKLNDICERIADAILADNIFSKPELIVKIRSILKIWFWKRAEPRSNAGGSENKYNKVVQTLHKEKVECLYWRKEIRKLISENEMKFHYIELEKLRKELNLEPWKNTTMTD